MNKLFFTPILAFFAALFLATSLYAADATRLGRDLTPLGSDPKASADGSIPAWKGGITTPPAGYVRGESHIDPFATDKPLYTITAANAGKYASKLMVGQLALLNKHPATYKMHVYKSRRSCALPQVVYDATRKNVTRAKLVDGGNGVEGGLIGVPFPIPNKAVEVFWNHNFHWQGGYRYSAKTLGGTIYPNGDWARVVREDKRFGHYANPQSTAADLKNRQFDWLGIWSAPNRFAGSGFSMTNTINQKRQPRHGFFYRPDLRKIVRATPTSATHDSPLTTGFGLRNSDNMFLFNGSPDRYNWKLLGKKEMLIPYNAYKITHTDLDPETLLTPNHMHTDYPRYEAHRVWVLEATLKEGATAVYHRRVFYVDEDSWIFAGSDLYDENNKLVRFQEAFIKNYYEAPACLQDFDVMYDLASGRYNIDHLKLEFGPANLDDEEVSPKNFGSMSLKRAAGR